MFDETGVGVSPPVQPIYLVVDQSAGATTEIDALNDGLDRVLDAVFANFITASKVVLSVVGFSEDSLLHLPMTSARDVEMMPRLVSRPGRSYVSAFETLSELIPSDVAG